VLFRSWMVVSLLGFGIDREGEVDSSVDMDVDLSHGIPFCVFFFSFFGSTHAWYLSFGRFLWRSGGVLPEF